MYYITVKTVEVKSQEQAVLIIIPYKHNSFYLINYLQYISRWGGG